MSDEIHILIDLYGNIKINSEERDIDLENFDEKENSEKRNKLKTSVIKHFNEMSDKEELEFYRNLLDLEIISAEKVSENNSENIYDFQDRED